MKTKHLLLMLGMLFLFLEISGIIYTHDLPQSTTNWGLDPEAVEEIDCIMCGYGGAEVDAGIQIKGVNPHPCANDMTKTCMYVPTLRPYRSYKN